MHVTRIYTGDDGHSKFEDLDVPLRDIAYGRISGTIPVNRAALREVPVDGIYDWHIAPARQFVVLLTGGEELECHDGTKRRFGPGSIILADDTSGSGHITREFGDPGTQVIIPIAADFDLDQWRPS